MNLDCESILVISLSYLIIVVKCTFLNILKLSNVKSYILKIIESFTFKENIDYLHPSSFYYHFINDMSINISHPTEKYLRIYQLVTIIIIIKLTE